MKEKGTLKVRPWSNTSGEQNWGGATDGCETTLQLFALKTPEKGEMPTRSVKSEKGSTGGESGKVNKTQRGGK